MRLTLTDGRTRAKTVTHPRGTSDRTLANSDILDKYRKLTDRAISSQRQTAIENTILNIDALDDIAHLTSLLTPTVQSPLD